jgi:hypothetical protein
VGAAPADHFLITAAPTAISGTPFDITLAAVDHYGNVDTSYAGTVTFTSTDTDLRVVLPPDYTFQSGDSGTHTFTAGVILVTPGGQSLIATDTANGTINGSAVITVSAPPAPPRGSSAIGPRNTTGIIERTRSGQEAVLVDLLFQSVHDRESWIILPRPKRISALSVRLCL